MKFTLYVRAAKHPRFQTRSRRIEASMQPNHKPLTIGYEQKPIHTAFFRLELDIPDELLEEAQMPTYQVELETGDVTCVTPTIVAGPAPVIEEEVPYAQGQHPE